MLRGFGQMLRGRHKILRSRGVLGINQRNAEFILPYNSREAYPLVDDKLKTKKLAQQAGITVPELFGTVEIAHQVRDLDKMLAAHSSFVIKPASGSGGQGIIVVADQLKGRYRTVHGSLLSLEAITHHVLNILSGIYSLGGLQDTAIIEYRVIPDPLFENVTYRGVPDIRIIVFQDVPVMAMLRLPTSLSEGKANLHQGAIGVGLNMRNGETMTAVCGNSIVSEHPDTAESVIGLKIPHWDSLLALASKCAKLTGLGYQGVDIVLDKDKGPMVLEINARPGLSIQIANRAGLVTRLRKVQLSRDSLTTPEVRIEFAKREFGF